uniref:Immunoglobulin V-set domain-containing protein n=2 Tax=Myotis lucifugus TaxID=59463 RepID=G1Q4U6_MYOLU
VPDGISSDIAMSNRFFCCVVICLIGVGHQDAVVTQFPRHRILGTRKELTLECSQNMNHISMYWYRQDPGYGLQLIYYSNGIRTIAKGDVPEGYRVSRSELKYFPLTLESASTNQTSVYFCASSDSTALQGHILSAQNRGEARREGTL